MSITKTREVFSLPNVHYAKNVEGRVIVKFYIDRNGSCSQFKVLRSLNSSFDAEALRVLKLMPKWNMSSMERGGAWYVLPVFLRNKMFNNKSIWL